MRSRIGAPGRARTCDLLIRSQTLYPTELRVPKRVKGKWSIVTSTLKALFLKFANTFSVIFLN
jgi:hypothetical protein